LRRKLKRLIGNSHDPPYRYLNDNINQGGQEVGEQTSGSGSSPSSFLCPGVSHTELLYKVLNKKGRVFLNQINLIGFKSSIRKLYWKVKVKPIPAAFAS
jgi:hypothetical protein